MKTKKTIITALLAIMSFNAMAQEAHGQAISTFKAQNCHWCSTSRQRVAP